jgi:superoxide reductase
MKKFDELLQSADWKTEKHVPVIEIIKKEKKDKPVEVNVSIGKEIAHPNTTAHHIKWIELYFLADGEKFPYLISRTNFEAHGASVEGPDTSSIYTHPSVNVNFITGKPGIIYAFSYCNIHGLWTNSEELNF